MDLRIGQQATRALTVDAAKVRAYAEITGDYNKLHFDEAWTAGTRFERLSAQGGIAVGLLHALVAMDMPGAGTVFIEQHWNYPAPVFIGDTIEGEATVTWVHESKPVAKLEFRVANQDGVEVLNGDATIYQAVSET
jgi:3-hydroxybutyryl-CoA dehydratase/enoyl-CoA hydratase